MLEHSVITLLWGTKIGKEGQFWLPKLVQGTIFGGGLIFHYSAKENDGTRFANS